MSITPDLPVLTAFVGVGAGGQGAVYCISYRALARACRLAAPGREYERGALGLRHCAIASLCPVGRRRASPGAIEAVIVLALDGEDVCLGAQEEDVG